jgi:hypothetical protein
MLYGAILLALAFPYPVNAAPALNFPPSDFDILSVETGLLIGHAHYSVDQQPHSLILHGESRYLTGEYDIEEDHLSIAGNGGVPKLISFRHDFFNADGSPSVKSMLDIATGMAVCGKDLEGNLDLAEKKLSIPENTYAGASVLLPIQELVARVDRSRTMQLHVFNCAPAPRLIAVDIKLGSHAQTWPEYPGDLEKIDIKANFGFWTVVIQPFIPKLAAWFDPSQNMLLVGVQLQRYYKGEKIILVRKREASITKAPTAPDPAPR